MEKNYFTKLPSKFKKIIELTSTLAEKHKMNVYLVGGPVRDILMKRAINDLDFVVEGNAIHFARAFKNEVQGKLRGYPAFKTATVTMESGESVDFTTARSESYAVPGALPRVIEAGLKEDLHRRDFTINAMAISVNPDSYGELIDHWDGKKDIKKKAIRVLHDDSFKDDPTRLLRAIRFEQRLGFRIAPATLKLIRAAVKGKFERTVTLPRYFEEFKKGLSEDNPYLFLKRLHGLKALDFMPDRKTSGLKQVERIVKEWTKGKFIHEPEDIELWKIVLMGLCEGMDENDIRLFFTKAQCHKQVIRSLQDAALISEASVPLKKPRISKSQVYESLNPFHPENILFIFLTAKESVVKRRVKDYWKNLRFIHLYMTGHDIKKLLPLDPAEIGPILRAVLRAKLDGKIKSKDEELEFAQKVAMENKEIKESEDE